MKKHFIILSVIASYLFATNAIAQIDNLNNMSAEWIRSGARNASVDGTDIMVYNPGGMALLKQGFHIDLGNQSFIRRPSHEYDFGFGKSKYTQEGNDLIVPNLFLSYNKNKWALFGGLYIAGGGATANFPKGSITTDLISLGALGAYMGAYTSAKNQYLKASSYYLATAIGGSYKANDKFSFGLFFRNIAAKNKTEAGFTLTGSPIQDPDAPVLFKTEDNASGFGVVAGVDVKPFTKFNITLRYESKVTLDFKTKIINDDLSLAIDGEKNRRDLPSVAGVGLGYTVNNKLKILYDFNYYFQTGANWGRTDIATSNLELSKLAGNALSTAIAFEYNFTPKMLASAGAVYTLDNYQDKPNYFTHFGAYEVVQDNNICFNAGIAYNVTKKIKINAGLFHAFYPKDKKVPSVNAGGVDVTINNAVTGIGVGLELLF